MSEKQEKKCRYNARLEYIARFDSWLESEPPMILFRKWRKWKKQRPQYDPIEHRVMKENTR